MQNNLLTAGFFRVKEITSAAHRIAVAIQNFFGRRGTVQLLLGGETTGSQMCLGKIRTEVNKGMTEPSTLLTWK